MTQFLSIDLQALDFEKSARRASNIQEDAYKGARPRLKTCYPEEKQNILVSKQDS